MGFIANGDFSLPLHASQYWTDHLYLWSYRRGAANPDGIMRFPSRFIDILVFAASGNIVTSYFFLGSCLALSFVAFWWFSRVFLGAERWGVALLGSMFYTFNPIFLGNLSKIGLILAVSMLPVMLAALKQGFTQRRFSYLWLFVLALNVSLVHPFTFSVNVVVAGVYLVVLARKHTTFLRDSIFKFAGLILVALLLNAYLILPLVSLGTLDKSALSDTVSSAPVDYTKLVDIANTGDIFTGLSLSKGVLKDYEFYGARSWPFYFLGVFLFYGLLFGAYIRAERRAKPVDRQRFVLAIGLFLALLALSTASFLRADILLKFLIGLPGGWMFRSPLKWQLYMPLLLMTALVIAVKVIHTSWRLKLLYSVFGVSFILMNGYLCTQVFTRLLTPRNFAYFSALNQKDLAHKNVLFADADACMTYARDHPGVATELNEVFLSQEVQVKHVAATDIDTVPLNQFDYVIGCHGTIDKHLLTEQYAFSADETFAEETYELYHNTKPSELVSTVSQPLQLTQASGLGGKYQIATQQLGIPFAFVDGKGAGDKTLGLQNPFDGLSTAFLKNNTLQSEVQPIVPGTQHILVQPGPDLYYQVHDASLFIGPTAQKDTTKVAAHQSIDVTVPAGQTLRITYQDPAFSYINLIDNPSLEAGLWQSTVGDCNAYDDHPILAMKLSDRQASEGQKALFLSAVDHIACTGPNNIAVQPGEHLLLSFMYQSPDDFAGYFVGFDDTAQSSYNKRLPKTRGWQTFSTELVVPAGATSLHFVVYAYPDGGPGRSGTALYDDFRLFQIPAISNRLYILSGTQTTNRPGPTTTFTVLNPTKTLVHVQAREPFYLTTKESYHPMWQLHNNTGTAGLKALAHAPTPIGSHLKVNGLFNGWYIDPSVLCATGQAACSQAADGTYAMDLVISFAPQRWVYLGGVISLVTFVGVSAYVIQDFWRHRRKEQ